jgi:hypothetical protein
LASLLLLVWGWEDRVEGAIFWWEISIKGGWRGSEQNEMAVILQLTYELQLFDSGLVGGGGGYCCCCG